MFDYGFMIPEDKEQVEELLKENSLYHLENKLIPYNKYHLPKTEDLEYILVAKYGDKVVGVLGAKMRYENTCHISYVYVKEEYRNQGIATKLLNIFKEEISKTGCSYISISCALGNEAARELYIKRGFQPWSIQMQLDLTNSQK